MLTIHNVLALDEARGVLGPQSLADIIDRAHDEILSAADDRESLQVARQSALAFLEVAHERLVGRSHVLSADCWCGPEVEAVS